MLNRALVWILIAGLGLLGTVTWAATAVVGVPGTSNPWLAGMPNGSTASGGDTAPAQSPVRVTGLTLVPANTLQFSASGLVANGPAFTLVGPDGDASSILSHSPGAENGISDVTAPINSLLGIFLDNSQPNLSAPPTPLSFSTTATRDYLTLAPALKQVFFIGDGLTSGGVPQQVIIPTGATRLFLGTMDGFGWSNNLGSFDVTVTDTTQVTTVSAASFAGGPLAPDSIVSAFGQGFTSATEVATRTPLPTTLAGVTVRVADSAGAGRLAQLFFASPGQINFLMPAGMQPGQATVTVNSGNRIVASGTVRIEAVAPGLFTANASGRGTAAALALRVAADGSQTTQLAFQCGTTVGSCVPTPIDLGGPADQVILLLFGTGIRGRAGLSAVSVRIGGVDAEVLYAGPQGDFVGLDQVNARLPRSLSGRGDVEVVLSVSGRAANSVTVQMGGAPPPQPVPRITSLNPNSGQVGQTIASFTIAGENLASVTGIEFSPAAGITVTNLRSTATSVTAALSIASNAATGSRTVAVVTPSGRSNALPFTITQPSSTGSAPVISNVALTVSETGRTEVRLDFVDPDGDIVQGSLLNSATLTLLGVTSSAACSTTIFGVFHGPGQTSGTIQYAYNARGPALRGQVTVRVWLTDAARNQSNIVDISTSVFFCN